MQKFSSNVIEKFLQKGGEQVIAKFVEEICFMNRIVDLMKNNYGNYVVQKVLKIANLETRKKLIDLICKHFDKIGDKKLILKWKNIIQSNYELQQSTNKNQRHYNENLILNSNNSYNYNNNNLNVNYNGNVPLELNKFHSDGGNN